MTAFDNTHNDWETESRIGNCSNRHQGIYKKVVAVCSAGMLRSPTIAHVLCKAPFNYNTRSYGLERAYALNVLDEVALRWCDEVVCADDEHAERVKELMREWNVESKPIVNLRIPDRFEYRSPKLVKMIKERYKAYDKNSN